MPSKEEIIAECINRYACSPSIAIAKEDKHFTKNGKDKHRCRNHCDGLHMGGMSEMKNCARAILEELARMGQ